jgi:hypothetical protein
MFGQFWQIGCEGEGEWGLTDCAGGVVPSRSVEDAHKRVIVDCRVHLPCVSRKSAGNKYRERRVDSLSWGASFTKS